MHCCLVRLGLLLTQHVKYVCARDLSTHIKACFNDVLTLTLTREFGQR